MTADLLPAVPPLLVFTVGAALVALASGKVRGLLALLTPLLSYGAMLAYGEGAHGRVELLGYELTLMRVDRLSLLFGHLFHLTAFVGVIYTLHLKDRLQQSMALVYSGAALGAVFAGDLITLFVAWELLALTSVFLILARRTERSYRAGMRYLVMNVLSGVLLLAGALVHVHETGSLAFTAMGLDGVGTWLIFIAFGIKCAWPGVHTWVVDAYPEATPTGTLFLSAFTTKCAIYALVRGFPGADPLIYIGAAMTFFPIFYAVIENDLRRVLSYSMVNQLGFMVVGIGVGTELALNGAVAVCFAHVIYKGLLFMSMGAVLQQTGRIHASDLGGLYKTMPRTATCCAIAAASISGFPLFSGFITKAMVMSAAAQEGHTFVWLILLFAAAGVVEHAGIKVPFFAFFAHDSGLRPKEAPWNMQVAMVIFAAFCVGIGCYPPLLLDLLPWTSEYHAYTTSHVLTQMQLLFFSSLAVFTLMRRGAYPPEKHAVNLDVDWLHRRPLPAVVFGVAAFAMLVWSAVVGTLRGAVSWGLHRLEKDSGIVALAGRTWPSGFSALFAAILLAVLLLYYYLLP